MTIEIKDFDQKLTQDQLKSESLKYDIERLEQIEQMASESHSLRKQAVSGLRQREADTIFKGVDSI